MKRIVSLVLALSMILSMFTFAFAGTSLKDVKGTKYEAAVEALIELGVVEGYPDGTYLPNNVVTRNELAKLLVVAYGLEPAAEASKGATPFADINAVANHWASGYINVSADYKFVNGYPDGSFKGDSTVTYAEAITMCLRVLGYANEIESKGTWPTNYIAKAQDLKLMEDIEFTSYNDGAKRGDIALLIWNMLRTPMWEITGESEGDGLQSAPDRYMLNVKFADYAYTDEAKFESFTIRNDKDEAKVYVSLSSPVVKGTNESVLENTEYEYAGLDFYTFVKGEEVEVLVNEEDKILLTMVATGTDKKVEGTKEEMVDADYDALKGASFDYAYGLLKNRDVVDNTTISTDSIFVDKVETSNKGKVTITSNKADTVSFTAAECDSELFLKNGEKVAIKDIEVGEILTKVIVNSGTEQEAFYVIGLAEEEGELTKYVVANYDDGVEYHTITVGGEEYLLDATDAMYVEDPSKAKVNPQKFATSYSDKMRGEEVVLKLDPVYGKVIRIEFDGKIDAGGETGNWKFFGVASDVTTSYEIELMDTTGNVETYSFANNTIARQYFNYNGRLEGCFIAAELNDDDKISSLVVIASNVSGKGEILSTDNIVYGDLTVNPNEYYQLIPETEATFNEDTNKFAGMLVTSNTVVARVVFDDNGTVRTSDDEWYVEFVEDGLKELENVSASGEKAVVIMDKDDSLNRVKIVVLFSEKSSKTDALVGIIESLKANLLNKRKQDVTFKDGTTLTTEEGVAVAETTEVAIYKVKENSKSEEFMNVIFELNRSVLVSGDTTSSVKYVVEADGKLVKFEGESEKDFGSDANVKAYDDYVVVNVSVVLDTDTQYRASTAEVIDYEDLTFVADDRVIIDDTAKVIIVISGMAEK